MIIYYLNIFKHKLLFLIRIDSHRYTISDIWEERKGKDMILQSKVEFYQKKKKR
jgi:hypothetical protein